MKKNDKINMGVKVLFCLIFPLFSCSTKSDHITDKLTGTWGLDSELYVSGGMQKISGESRVFKFFSDGGYSYLTWQGDINGQAYGKFFILENPNRKISTITFIPNLRDGYVYYLNYDIISVSDSFLKLAEPTRIIMKDDKQSSFMFNGQLIYKKHK